MFPLDTEIHLTLILLLISLLGINLHIFVTLNVMSHYAVGGGAYTSVEIWVRFFHHIDFLLHVLG